MNCFHRSLLAALFALPIAGLTACQGKEAEEEGLGTTDDRTPGGSLGTTGTGADHPAPEEVTNDE